MITKEKMIMITNEKVTKEKVIMFTKEQMMMITQRVVMINFFLSV